MKGAAESLLRAEVLELMFSRWRPQPAIEYVPLREAAGRVLAETLYSRHDLPVVRASMMDGVAVEAARFAAGAPDTSEWVCGRDYVRADTGDDFDDRFDAVIRIEDVSLEGGGIALAPGQPVVPGLNVRGRGSTLREGALLVEAGLPLRGGDLAALAMGGFFEVPVRARPKVAFVPTGSELIAPGTPLARGKNYDSNSLMAEYMLREMGAEPIVLPITPDEPEALRAAFRRALAAADIVIMNGGSSKGDEDFNTRLLASEGELLLHGSAAGPGRPIGIAVVGEKLAVNLAGPSLGAFYGLDWCIRPAVSRMLGIPVTARQTVTGRLMRPLRCPLPIEFICRVEVRRADEGYVVYPQSRGEADLAAMLRSNAMFVSPRGESLYPEGGELTVELLRNAAFIPEDTEA